MLAQSARFELNWMGGVGGGGGGEGGGMYSYRSSDAFNAEQPSSRRASS